MAEMFVKRSEKNYVLAVTLQSDFYGNFTKFRLYVKLIKLMFNS